MTGRAAADQSVILGRWKADRILAGKEGEISSEIENTGMILITGIAALYDIRTWKIPNWLILVGLETGIFITVWQDGVRIGCIHTLAGIGIPIAILYVMFLAGWLGAGDIKLFSAVGAFCGFMICKIVLYAFIAGGCLSLLYVIDLILCRRKRYSSEGRPDRHRIHFSLAIWIACLVYAVSG